MIRSTPRVRNLAGLLVLTGFALLIHGYHPYAEDAEIYLPGILKILHPNLFPANAIFFGEHAGHTLYPNLIASTVRLTHLGLPWVVFLWHLLSMFLYLAAGLRLAGAFFESWQARWSAVALMAGLLTLPVAGTRLYLLDQYLNPRNLAAFAGLFAVAEVLSSKYGPASLWLVFAAAVHPLMASFAIAFCALLVVLNHYQPRFLGFAALLPFGLTLDAPPPEFHEVARRQSYFYIQTWTWYEWLGILGPALMFWWFAHSARRRGAKNIELVSRSAMVLIFMGTLAAVVLSLPARFEALARIEPLRCLALSYMLLIVIGGGLVGEKILQLRTWRWIVLFLPLTVGMYIAQRQLFPASQHIEWPWMKPRNPWAQAFDWIRDHTPTDALFALNPDHMSLLGEDENGFRARAQRSRLADAVKDKGAASMFPPLAVPWLEQIQDQRGWSQFGIKDFERLRQKYGIGWIVTEQHGPEELSCPYQNSAVRVCRLN